MKTTDVIEHFGSQVAVARAIGVNQAAVSQWGESPPPLRQLQIEGITGGVLRAGHECDLYRVPTQAAA